VTLMLGGQFIDMAKKILSILFVFSLLFTFDPLLKVSASNSTFPQETTVHLNTQNMDIKVEANSAVDSITVDENKLTITVTHPDSFVIRSDNRYKLTNDSNIGIGCEDTYSKLTVQPSSGAQTIVITPSTDTCVKSTSSNNSNSSSTTVCNDQQPGTKAPWLYGAITQDSSSVLLYFTPADNPVSKYVLEYGTKSGDYSYGVQDMGINSQNQMTFLVKSLSQNTTYYFKVRGGNGCATGSWSNEISAKTKGLVSYNQLDISNLELKTKPAEKIKAKKDTKEDVNNGYDLKIKVVDTNKKPIIGAKVTIHSKVRTAISNKDGIAVFKNVEAGDHKVLIAYNNFEGEQSINLTGNVKEFDLNITIKQKAASLSPLAYGIIGVMGLAIFLLITIIIKKR